MTIDLGNFFWEHPAAAQLILYLVFGLLSILLLVAFRFYCKMLARQAYVFKRRVLLVTVTKEAEELVAKEEAVDKKQNLKEIIAVAEGFYANLLGIKKHRYWGYFFYRLKEWWFGNHGHVSLEIVSHDGLIKFYVVCMEELQEYVEQQIHATFPTASIEEAPDYNIFSAHGQIAGVYLKLTQDQTLPLKTFKKMDHDPLENLTNNLSKIQKDEGAAIQISLRPAAGRWRQRASKLAQTMHKGERLETALAERSLFQKILSKTFLLPFYFLEFFYNAFFPSKGRENDMLTKSEKDKQPPVRLSKREEELITAIEEKVGKACFETNIRLMVSAPSYERSQQLLRGLIGSFSQYDSHQTGNRLAEKVIWWKKRFVHDFIYRNFRESKEAILCSEELASIFHLPLPSTETPNILWLRARLAPPPVNLPGEGIILGKSIYRGTETLVRLKKDDRRRHVYIIGMTGTGKSVLMSNLAVQDIKNGQGICVLDPHGSLAEDIIGQVPRERLEDVIYFNPADIERPVGLNMLEAKDANEMDFACQEMISIFYKLVTDPAMIGPMFEHNMRNAMLTLMADKEYPGTITEVPRIFTDEEFQEYKLTKVKDPMVRAFWEKEMAKTSDFHKSEMLGYLISKVGRFVENEMMRNIIGQPKSGFNFQEAMDQGKILIVNLNKGKIGEVNSNLLGLIIVSKLQMAAMARDVKDPNLKDFYLYIDEFQNYVTDSIATILAEARKYKLNLIMAHQYIGQLVHGTNIEGKSQDTKIKDAVFGNAGTMACFRIGVEDAETMAKQFKPTFNEYDVINIPRFNAYLRLMIDNSMSKPFNMATFAPEQGNALMAAKAKQLSRLKYGRDKSIVEAEILERSRLGEAVKDADTGDVERSL